MVAMWPSVLRLLAAMLLSVRWVQLLVVEAMLLEWCGSRWWCGLWRSNVALGGALGGGVALMLSGVALEPLC